MARLLVSRQHDRAYDRTVGFGPVLILCAFAICISLAVFGGVLGHCRCQTCDRRADLEFGPGHPPVSRYSDWRVVYQTAKAHSRRPNNVSLHGACWIACPEEDEEGWSPRDHQVNPDASSRRMGNMAV